MLDLQDARKQLQEVGRYMMNNQLAWGNAGNISVRTGADRCLITASGTYLGELNELDLVETTFSGTVIGANQRKPSKEVPMHRAVYEARPDINAVLHASPFYSTLFACTNEKIPSDWIVESMYYLERVERVAYQHPGSQALGDAVREKAAQSNVLLLENHGVLVYDTSVKEARMALHTLELVCRMWITASSANVNMRSLSPETVQDFLLHSGYKARREWPV